MKFLFLIALALSGSQAFNPGACAKDLEGLALSYSRAVIDWNLLIYYKQAVQEMGYALQYLGAVLIDCNIFSVFTLEKTVLQMAGEQLTAYDGPVDDFSRLYNYVSEDICEEKLHTLYENAHHFIKNGNGVQHILQSLHDLMATCESGLTS